MSHSSYTASERRGVLAIALVALLLIGVGAGVSMWNGSRETEEMPAVVEHAEMIDSVAIKEEAENKSAGKKTETSVKKSKTGKTKTPKTYRRRNPLDEPV